MIDSDKYLWKTVAHWVNVVPGGASANMARESAKPAPLIRNRSRAHPPRCVGLLPVEGAARMPAARPTKTHKNKLLSRLLWGVIHMFDLYLSILHHLVGKSPYLLKSWFDS